MNLSPRLWNAVIVTSRLGTSAAQAGSCSVPGGASSSPTDFARYVSKEACNEFILEDGWYTFPNCVPSIVDDLRLTSGNSGKDYLPSENLCDNRESNTEGSHRPRA